MIDRWRLVGHVAWWEFRRAWRAKDVVMTVVFSVASALGWMGVLKLWEWNTSAAPAQVAVLRTGAADMPVRFGPNLAAASTDDRDEEALRAAVDEGTIDALLVIEGAGAGRLYVERSPEWLADLQGALDEAGRAVRLRAAGVRPEVFAQLATPFELTVQESRDADGGRSSQIAAGIFVGLMLFAVLLGNSCLFIYITGEKQQRVTEQIVSVISPQTWIDGKIAGLSLVALVSMLSFVAGMIIWNLTLTLFGQGYDLWFTGVSVGLLGQLLVLSILGFLFWFAFFGAIAATADDPNTSARGLFIFVPLLPLSVAVGCFQDPDTVLMRFCGVFPLTAPSVLPARLVLGEVYAWELTLAAALLIGAIWLMRRIAGKLFALGIMMHGKEPRWRDMLRALRAG